jgi:hypothetical protein
MYTPFHQMPAGSRVWIYAAPRPFTSQELLHINSSAPPFLESWETHGTPLQASYQVMEEQFLVLAIDEAVQPASGCSIDSSMGYIRSLEQQLGLALSDRSLLYFKQDGRVQAYPLAEIKATIARGSITPETLLINTLAATKAALETNWLIPAGGSWLKRHFKKDLA